MDESNKINKTLLILDGFAVIFRVYYSRQPMSTSTGITTTIVQGFLSILFKLINEVNPSHIILAMDSKGPTFRHEEYPEYKAGRDPAPPDLTEQIPTLEKVINSFGIPIYSVEKYEADDLIGTISSSNLTKDFKKIIVSGDKDLFQLIDENTSIWYSSPNRFSSDRLVSSDTYQDEKGFEGISPKNVPDLKGLAGDSSDNIKGIPGIGQKVAISLLNKYKDLDTIYENIDQIPDLDIRGASRVQSLLSQYKENAYQSRMLATINTKAPLNHSTGENISTQNLAKIKRLFEDPAIEKYAHNANYDLSVLVNNNFEVNNLNFDTLIAANLLGKRTLGLKNLSLEILGLEMMPIEDLIGKGKDKISFRDVDIEKAIYYACADRYSY